MSASIKKVKPIWILLKQETVPVASAVPYANLHLAQTTGSIFFCKQQRYDVIKHAFHATKYTNLCQTITGHLHQR